MGETTYNIRMDNGETLQLRADMVQASAPIFFRWDKRDDWNQSQYQTADARHRIDQAVALFLGDDDVVLDIDEA